VRPWGDEAAYRCGEGCAVPFQALRGPGVLGGRIRHGEEAKPAGDDPQRQRQQVGRFQFSGDDPVLLRQGDGFDLLAAPLDSGGVPAFEVAPGVQPQELGTGEEVVEQGARETGEVGRGERDGVENCVYTLGEDLSKSCSLLP
jgi:hypothetical protein